MARKNKGTNKDVSEEILEDGFFDESANAEGDWMEGDDEQDFAGQLAVDVYQTKESVVIKAPIAGVNPNDLDIAISDDVVTIKGDRKDESVIEKEHYYVQECFWGSFSRSVILPTSTVPEKAEATLKNGVLTIEIPKVAQEKVKKIVVRPG